MRFPERRFPNYGAFKSVMGKTAQTGKSRVICTKLILRTVFPAAKYIMRKEPPLSKSGGSLCECNSNVF